MTHFGRQFTLKILSKPSSRLGSTNRDLDCKYECLLVSTEHLALDGSILPPILVEQRLLDFGVGGVCQLSEYIVVPKRQEMWKTFAFSFLRNCPRPLVQVWKIGLLFAAPRFQNKQLNFPNKQSHPKCQKMIHRKANHQHKIISYLA